MIGYLFTILALIIVIPLVIMLARGKPRTKRTALEHPHGHERTEPAQEQAVPAEAETAPARRHHAD